MRHAWLRWVILGLALTIVACSDGGTPGGDQSGRSRPYRMGISTLPRELNSESYAEAFELAGRAGDMVLIQRTPPWADFLPGGDVSASTADTTAAEVEAAQDQGLEIFFAIDPTDSSTGRDRLAGLPPSHEGRGFEDPDIREAFSSYAEYVAINYDPAYLALGVEMNLYYRRNQSAFEDFITLYQEAYDRVNAVSPDTQVTVTFQFEDLQSILPTEDRHFPDWPLLDRFGDRLDVAAISTYPSFAFAAASQIPVNYYSQLRGFTDKPIVIAEMGFSSAPGEQGVNSGSEAEQAAFVERALEEAEDLEMPFVVWFAGWDPQYAEGTAFAAFRDIGLLRADGMEKPAWAIWQEAANRPYRR